MTWWWWFAIGAGVAFIQVAWDWVRHPTTPHSVGSAIAGFVVACVAGGVVIGTVLWVVAKLFA